MELGFSTVLLDIPQRRGGSSARPPCHPRGRRRPAMSRLLQDYARDGPSTTAGRWPWCSATSGSPTPNSIGAATSWRASWCRWGASAGSGSACSSTSRRGRSWPCSRPSRRGCAYVPVDVAGPAPRTARIVTAADPAARSRRRSAGPRPGSGRSLCRHRGVTSASAPSISPAAERLAGTVAFGPGDVAAQIAEPPPRTGAGGDLAHILFTSGSTGAPKGVMITHDNVTAFVDWAVGHFGIAPDDRISGHPPLHFDLSTFDIYGALCAGAELHLVPGGLVMARQLAAVHLRPRADAVVLRAVGHDLHGAVRRPARRGVPVAAAYPVVRGGAAHAGADRVDAASSAGELHEPLWADGDDDRQQLPRRRPRPGQSGSPDPDRPGLRRGRVVRAQRRWEGGTGR